MIKLTLNHVKGVFGLLLFGIFSATIVFCVELVEQKNRLWQNERAYKLD